jgi:hypothetical protein
VAQWNRRRWLVYQLVETVCTCDGSTSYTVGAGGDFNIARPANIAAAFIRQTTSTPLEVDFYLDEIMSREEYSQIAIKGLHAAPSTHFFYDSGYPTGTLYPWPIPNAGYDLHILTPAVITAPTSINEAMVLPPEYFAALKDELAVQTRRGYGQPQNPDLVLAAKASLATIRKANFQVGRLSMPKAIGPGVAYNPYSDQGN